MLLCADWILPISGPSLAEGAVLVSEGVIQAVGPAAGLRARYPEEETRGFPGCALLPGLVNAHTHLEYSAFKGFARPSGFGSWMLSLLLARRKLDTEDYVASALWGAYECMRSGVTCIADTSHDGWPVARAARSAGLRARVYLELFGIDDAHLPATMARLETALERLRDECGAEAVGRPAGGSRTAAAGSGALVEAGLSPMLPTRCRRGCTGRRRASRAAPACAWPRMWPSRRPKSDCSCKEGGRSPTPTGWRAYGGAAAGAPRA